jgi:hypothetical protein
MFMRQMLGALILGTMLTIPPIAAHANGATELGLPPLQPMGGAAVLAQADEPDVQQAPRPYWVVQREENSDSGSDQ